MWRGKCAVPGWLDDNCMNFEDMWKEIGTWDKYFYIGLWAAYNTDDPVTRDSCFGPDNPFTQFIQTAIRGEAEVIIGQTLVPENVNGRYVDTFEIKLTIYYHKFMIANYRYKKTPLMGGTLDLISEGAQNSIYNIPSGSFVFVEIDGLYHSVTDLGPHYDNLLGWVKQQYWNEDITDYKIESKNYILDLDKYSQIAEFNQNYAFTLNSLHGTTMFRDPWYETPPSSDNQPNNFRAVSGTYDGLNERIFLNQVPIIGSPEIPYYSVYAPMYSNEEGFFDIVNWEATGADIIEDWQHPGDIHYRAVVFTAQNAEVTANYNQINNTSGTYILGEYETLVIPSGADITLTEGFNLEVKGTLVADNVRLASVRDEDPDPAGRITVAIEGEIDFTDVMLEEMDIYATKHRNWGAGNGPVSFKRCVFRNVEAPMSVTTTGAAPTPALDLLLMHNNTMDNTSLTIDNTIGSPIPYRKVWNIDFRDNIFYDSQLQIGIDSVDYNEDYNLFYECTYMLFIDDDPIFPIQYGPNTIVYENPLLKDASSGDYTLKYGSPCIDAGDPDLDDDGTNWPSDPDDQDPDGTRLDMGAYYFPQYAGTFSSDLTLDRDAAIVGNAVFYNLTVPSGKILTVEKDLSVKFQNSKMLRIYGTLIAEGEDDDHIIFTRSGSSGTWYGIKFENSSVDDSCIIQHADIKYATYGVYCYQANPRIWNNDILHNKYSLYCYNSSPSVKNNTIKENISTNYYLVYLNQSSPYMYNNHIETLGFANIGLFCYKSSPRLYHNLITGSMPYAVATAGSGCEPEFGDPDSDNGGLNEIHSSGADFLINAYSNSEPFFGSTFTCGAQHHQRGGDNSLTTDNDILVVASGGAYVDAQWNWWGDPDPDDNRFSSGVNHDYPLPSEPDDVGTLDKTVPQLASSSADSMVLETSKAAELWHRGCQFWLIGKYIQAITIFHQIVRDYPFAPEAIYALVKSADAHEKIGDISSLIDYLTVLSNTPPNAELGALALDLLHNAYFHMRDLDNAVKASRDILDRYPDTQLGYTALFDLFNIYYLDQADNARADETLAIMKERYPDYELTLLAQEESGETVDWSLAKSFAPSREVQQPVAAVPEEYRLGANYPNPFNPLTVIPYDLPEDARVTLVVYDILGREVIRLVEGMVPAGYYQVFWDGRDQNGSTVASGVYLCRIQANRFVKTRKMLFMK